MHVCVCVFVLQCKLEQQACLTGKELTLKCSGLCPCPTAAPASKESKRGEIKHTTADTTTVTEAKINSYEFTSLLFKASHLPSVITSLSFTLCFSHTHWSTTTVNIMAWIGRRNITYVLSLWPPQTAVRDKIWLISGSVWGTGSSYCRPMPSRTTIASLGPEPLQPAPHQVGLYNESQLY